MLLFKRSLTLFVIIFFSSLSMANLTDLVSIEEKKPSAPPAQISSYQFIFVDGFLGDIFKNNYIPALHVLKTWSINDPVVIRPISTNPIEVNAEILYKKIVTLRKQSNKPNSLVIGHSKAGPELFLAVLRHPDLITQGYITQLVVIDGAMEGTPLANWWTFVCVDHSSPLKTESLQDTLLCKELASYGPTLEALRPGHVKPLINSALDALPQETLTLVNAHLFYIRSKWGDASEEWASPLVMPHLFLQKYFGDNDGVILLSGQKYPQALGEELGIFNTDHLGLVHGTRFKKKTFVREAVIRALMIEMVSRSPLK